MTQPFTPSASNPTAPKQKRRTLSGVLVTKAAQEFIMRSSKLAEDGEKRAFKLLSRIAADMGDVEDAVIFVNTIASSAAWTKMTWFWNS
jgi:hypothetical protein